MAALAAAIRCWIATAASVILSCGRSGLAAHAAGAGARTGASTGAGAAAAAGAGAGATSGATAAAAGRALPRRPPPNVVAASTSQSDSESDDIDWFVEALLSENSSSSKGQCACGFRARRGAQGGKLPRIGGLEKTKGNFSADLVSGSASSCGCTSSWATAAETSSNKDRAGCAAATAGGDCGGDSGCGGGGAAAATGAAAGRDFGCTAFGGGVGAEALRAKPTALVLAGGDARALGGASSRAVLRGRGLAEPSSSSRTWLLRGPATPPRGEGPS